ncbi:MAG TPA: type II CAAX endopeptidase family protein [Anaerolineales bacterium]|nr:type II CAAX endopeptidase family protein [Anaerolineales bacterium]
MNHIFLSPDESRLRAGWRVLIQLILWIVFSFCLSVPIGIVLFLIDPSFIESPSQLPPAYLLLATIGETFAVTMSVFLARRFLDKESIESLGLKLNVQALIGIFAGIGITLIQMGFIYVLMLNLGWLTFEGFAWEFDPAGTVIQGVLTFLAIFLLVGWHEELLSRGYHLQTITSGLNLFWGVVISSAVFGALHLANPGASWRAVAGITLAGLLFAFAYIRTKQLWLPIGLHLGWNFFEGVAFGFPVSGLDIYALMRIDVTGPELWTGGAFGPEAGLIVLPSLIIGAGLIYVFTRNRVHR